MDQEIKKFLREQGGVMSVNELADLLELDEGKVRRWARENGGVRRIGSTFAFSKETAFACADDLLGADEDADDEDEDNEDGSDEDGDHDDEQDEEDEDNDED